MSPASLRRRRALALGVVAPLAFASPSVAGTPGCRVVVDPAGDAHTTPVGPVNDPDLDLLGTRVRSTSSALVLSVQLGRVEAIDPQSPGGVEYRLSLTVNHRRHYVVVAARHPDGDWFSVYGPNTVESGQLPATENYPFLANLTGSFDPSRATVDVTLPDRITDMRTGLPVLVREVSSEWAAGYSGNAAPGLGGNTTGSTVDQADGYREYVVGSRTC